MPKYRAPEGLDLLGFKKCTKCGKWLQRARFSKNKLKSDGLHSWCKKCTTDCSNKWNKKHPESIRKARTKWRKTNSEAHREANAKWREANPGYIREYKKQPMPAWKNKIRRETKQLIINGIVLHPGCCENCGVVADSETTIHIHHLTYLRPDRVMFLCPQCHQRWHNENQSPPEPTQEWVEHWYITYNDYPEEE